MPLNRTSPKLSLTAPVGGTISPEKGLRLSRSPHPYHQKYSGGQKNEDGFSESDSIKVTASPSGKKGDEASYFDTKHKRGRSRSSTSDSGTEADDESGIGGMLRGLPAPPLRLRKGFKDSRGLGTCSPLLTPSYLDEPGHIFHYNQTQKRIGDEQILLSEDEESVRIREKFTRRRRAELLRRVTETLLLGSVGCIACTKISGSLFSAWKRELLAYGFVLSGTYLLYPLRIIFLDHDGNYQGKPSLSRLRIPAAFDPAPLLYPTIIPVLVALSLAALNPTLLLPNLILSIAAIPRQVIPFYQTFFGYSSIQWFLSTVPVSVFKIWTSILPLNASGTDIFSLDPLSPENLTMLYPLHQALLPSLGYLTTTSLLSAELQLLSVSMINIYLFSKSPQSLILKALLWIGGLSIFVSCRVVLESGVALARVPRWRFRNPRRRSPRRGLAFFLAFNEHMQRFLSKRIFSRVQDTTESEDSQDSTPSITSRMRRAGEQKRKTHRRHGDKGRTSTTMLVSAIDGDTRNEFDISKLWSNRQRSQTLPTYLGTLTNDLHGEEGRLRKKGSQFTLNLSDPRFFMGLTEVQATAVKWLYAFYVYAIVLIIIMIPVRLFVSWNALQSHEPIGWALGYLFGDVPAFRAPVKSLDLGSWIPLPPALEPFSSSQNWIGGFRTLGAANIRLLICLYCITILGLGLRIVFHLTSFVEVDTRRKVFHGMMVVMFLPSILIDPCFCALALILVLATFLLLDLCRASQLPPLSRPLTNFLAPYVDGRDHRGPVIVSHIFLLIGCAIPLWLSLAAAPRTATGNSPWEGWDTPTRDLGMISGVVCVGMGDAAASLFGRRYGRRRWCWSGGKSLEGSLAFTLAVILGLVAAKIWLACCFLSAEGGKEYSSNNWGHGWWSMVIMGGKMTVAAAGASLTEAVLTGGNDNVIVPVILWLLVRGLGI